MAPVATAQAIDALLPQTQCTRCGYPGCAPYAAAISRGEAAINRCPPGGDSTIAALARLTGQPVSALDAACGAAAPLRVAVIDEARCIGCALCIAACPVDAIIGAAKRMHAVLPSLCSGCELCVAPCPVDCIAMLPAARAWTRADADAARARHALRTARLARGTHAARERVQASAPSTDTTSRSTAVAAALARARARRAAGA